MVARDLRDHLRRRDPERAREVRRGANSRLNRLRVLARLEERLRDLADVEVPLVEPGSLHGGNDSAHSLPHVLRVLAVERVAGTHEDGLRAAPERLGATHRRANAELPRDVVRRRDDTPSVWVAPDYERLRPEGGILELLDGCKEGIQVEMADDHGQEPRPWTFRHSLAVSGRAAPR